MQVLVANTLFPPNVVGGAEISVQALVEALAGLGLDVHVLTLADGEERRLRLSDRAEASFLRLHPLGNLLLNPNRTLWQKAAWHAVGEIPHASAALDRLLEEVRPAVVHTNNLTGLSTGVWRAAKRRGIPVVHTLRDYYLMCPRGTMFRNGASCARPCRDCALMTLPRRRATRMVDAVVGVSRFILERHLDAGCFPNARHALDIPIGYAPPEGAVRPPRPPGAPLRIGFIGRLHRTKGLDRLVQALPLLPRGGWTLSIAGKGQPDILSWLETAVAGFPVTLRGWVAADAFFREVDVLVAPATWQEPLGRTVAEALCHGVPVVASRVGGQQEQIRDGVNGLLYDPNSPGELADHLGRLIADPALADRLGDHAAAARVRFAPAAVAGAYRDLFHTVVAEAAGASR